MKPNTLFINNTDGKQMPYYLAIKKLKLKL